MTRKQSSRKVPDALAPRRPPEQARARDRFERILEASERMLVEGGFEALTMAAVAREAGVNIATLYERFPNRSALLRTLATRYAERLQGLVGIIAEEADPEHMEATVVRMIDAVHAFHLANPAYLAIWSGAQSQPDLKALDAEDTQAQAHTLAELLGRFDPPVHEPDATALAVLLAVGHILRHAAAAPEPVLLVNEAKRLALAYLEAACGEPHPD
jgi:AcrR family transcriptional regulator